MGDEDAVEALFGTGCLKDGVVEALRCESPDDPRVEPRRPAASTGTGRPADPSPPDRKPAAASALSPSSPSPPLLSGSWASEVFSQHLLECRYVQHRVPNRRFSLAFSNSRLRSRFASATSSPPYFERHLWNVASLIPYFQHNSATPHPAWCSFSVPMICSSLNRLLRMCPLLLGQTLTSR